jgi:hypothetical protein
LVLWILGKTIILTCLVALIIVILRARFGSNVYCVERILKDRIYLERLFSHESVILFLARPSNNPSANNVRRDFATLKTAFIYNDEMWNRVQLFVNVETSTRVLLRMTDGHAPTLKDVAFLFDTALRETLAVANGAVVKFPGLYPNLPNLIQAAFAKPRKDIVTPLVLAAAMINPSNVYGSHVRTLQEAYNPPGGADAIRAAFRKYYADDLDSQTQASVLYTNFRSGTGVWFEDAGRTRTACNLGNGQFWDIVQEEYPNYAGPELFRKLYYGYAGQGESERLNKKVKQFRTILRNRQIHETTSALCELHSYYSNVLRDKSRNVVLNCTWLESIRTKITEARNEADDVLNQDVEFLANGGQLIQEQGLNNFDPLDDDDEDLEYDMDEAEDILMVAIREAQENAEVPIANALAATDVI